MKRLWTITDYTERLSHPNELVRSWAFKAIETYHPRHYVREVSNLIGDPNEHLACAAPRYIAKHHGIEYAPMILECFKNSHGAVAGNCISALKTMKYDAAYLEVLEKKSQVSDVDETLGIIDYLAMIKTQESHDFLKNSFHQFKGDYFASSIVDSLLAHGHPEDIALIINHILKKNQNGMTINGFFKSLGHTVSDYGLYQDIAGDYVNLDIFENTENMFMDVMRYSPVISNQREKIDRISQLIISGQYDILISELIFEVKKAVQDRYGNEACPTYLEEMSRCDHAAIQILECMGEKTGVIREIRLKNEKGAKLLSIIIAISLSVISRELFVTASNPKASLSDLIISLKNCGPNAPESIKKRIIEMAPIADLQAALTNEWDTWGDIHIVRLMGQIGSPSFIPDLIRIINEVDSLSFVFGDAIQALQCIDDAGHPEIMAAIQNGRIPKSLTIMDILEAFPYEESFDVAYKMWNIEGEDHVDAHILLRIGDIRGIEALREILFEGNSISIGDPLETLCALYKKDIPELAMIHRQRNVEQKRREKRSNELFDLGRRNNDRDLMALAGDLPQQSVVETYQRNDPKVGRNDPCPCGSGKKHKKCCL